MLLAVASEGAAFVAVSVLTATRERQKRQWRFAARTGSSSYYPRTAHAAAAAAVTGGRLRLMIVIQQQ